MEIDFEMMLRGRLVGRVDHFRAGVLMLAVVRQRDGDELRRAPCGPS